VAKTKKDPGLLHPIDTVMHWYAEAQTIPAQLKKNFEAEKEKAHQQIKKLTAELKKAKVFQQKAKALKGQIVKKGKKKSSNLATAMVDKYTLQYQAAVAAVDKINDEIKSAKNHISASKIKQKYLNALEQAFVTVTKLFTRKHSKSLKKKTPKKRKTRTAATRRPAVKAKRKVSHKRKA
jgi:hypothetical protein